ncbi:hypothetical protein DXG01_005698 [Tephrocybe rancida]|nr:hypothetical protein DXG01_005698 [Tephrocybe rancida]
MEGRPRSNTSSFLAWRRPRTETTSATSTTTSNTPLSSPPTLSTDALLAALAPPSVPSLTHARALAASLTSCSPLPARSSLIPILATLCASDAPVALQAAGYDILAAYSEHPEAPLQSNADRLSFFALFLGPAPWAPDLWEPRLKALRALTKFGTDVVGIETDLLHVLQGWIAGVFDGLLLPDRLESEVLFNGETIARIDETSLAAVLDFYTLD